MSRPVIGIMGKARSGKDTIANHLVNKYNLLRIGIADRIKLTASIMFNTPILWFYTDNYKEKVIPKWNMSPRVMAQMIGTEAGRTLFGNNMWFDSIEEIIQQFDTGALVPQWLHDIPYSNLPSKYLDDYSGIVIPDARMDFELDWIKNDLNGQIYGVHRHIATGNVGIKNHPTETHVDMKKCDVVFDNNQTIEILLKCVDKQKK